MRTLSSTASCFGLLVLGLCLLGCGVEVVPSERVETTRHAILGGTLDAQHRNVAFLTSNFGKRCSAVLVAKNWVITAGHCVTDILVDEMHDVSHGAILPFAEASSVQVYFDGRHTFDEPAGNEGARYEGCETLLHPDFRMTIGEIVSPQVEKDLALVRLCRPAQGIAPAALTKTTVGLGDDVTLVGYGPTARESYDSGLRRSAETKAYSLGDLSYMVFYGPLNACKGDSGGAVFIERDGVQELTGVITNANCHWEPAKANGRAQSVAAAIYADWIAQHVPATDAPSPTCDGLGFIGDPCADDDACASGQCFDEAEHLFPGGQCTEPCARYCPDAPGKSTTFCVAMQTPEGERGYCISRCDFARYPSTGCRLGYACSDEPTPRFGESDVKERVCWPEDLLKADALAYDETPRAGCSTTGGEATRIVPLALLLALFFSMRRRYP